MSHEMFKHVVALNTYTEPFLALKPNDQRAIIEQLLGITLLSEKAELLKEQSKATKDAIQQEEANIKAVTDANKRIEEQIEATQRRQMLWLTKRKDDVAKLQTALDELLKLDIDAEIAAHKELSAYNQKRKDITDLDKAIARSEQDLTREVNGIANLTGDIATLREHKCNTCKQDLHDEKHIELLAIKESKLRDAETQQGVHAGDLEALIAAKSELGELGSQPKTFYDNEGLAIQHRSSIASIQEQIISKTAEEDPYTEQIADMKATALAEIDYTKMNELSRVKDHQEFLYKLLTNKDSYIRKRIIDQNLSYLNARLSQYLDRIGLPHTVVFMNDLSVNITELGRELDFDNLSRGERNRLILSLSWSFRDVWESLYQPINLLFIDELIDSGMDASGVENAMAILKKMSRDSHKSIWLVSHRDELGGRVNNVLTVVKENGFTSYNTDVYVN
jgi:DNA repair exonuclease SbcCD ATPase subunit